MFLKHQCNVSGQHEYWSKHFKSHFGNNNKSHQDSKHRHQSVYTKHIHSKPNCNDEKLQKHLGFIGNKHFKCHFSNVNKSHPVLKHRHQSETKLTHSKLNFNDKKLKKTLRIFKVFL